MYVKENVCEGKCTLKDINVFTNILDQQFSINSTNKVS